jgi:hypothetical protein
VSLDRAAIGAACGQATPGPWHWDGGTLVEEQHDAAIGVSLDGAAGNRNAALIAGARSWVPQLLDRLEQVEEAAAALLHASRPDASWGEHFEAETRLRVLLAERLQALEEGGPP